MKHIFVLLALILSVVPVQAQNLPALYDVYDVRSDDVLNVRSGTGTGHAIVGELAWNQRGVEV